MRQTVINFALKESLNQTRIPPQELDILNPRSCVSGA